MDLLRNWIFPTIIKTPNLLVFFSTVVKYVDSRDGFIHSITGIQRIPKSPYYSYNNTLSHEITDWYSPDESALFKKEVLKFVPRNSSSSTIFIDATEFGDVLVLANASYAQGIESPNEDSWQTENCGQTFVYPFYMRVEENPSMDKLYPLPPKGIDYSLDKYTWGKIWSYRRSLGLPGTSSHPCK